MPKNFYHPGFYSVIGINYLPCVWDAKRYIDKILKLSLKFKTQQKN